MSVAKEINDRFTALEPILRPREKYDVYLSRERIEQLKAEKHPNLSLDNNTVTLNGNRVIQHAQSDRLNDNRITLLGRGWFDRGLEEAQEVEQQVASREAAGIYMGGIWCG